MNYQLDAIHIFAQDDGCAVVVGFADDELEPSRLVIIQRSNNYDEQDWRLGMDKIHIQVEDESRSKYGGITAIQVVDNTVRILLSCEGRAGLSIDGDIELACLAAASGFEEAVSLIKKMCAAEGIAFTCEFNADSQQG